MTDADYNLGKIEGYLIAVNAPQPILTAAASLYGQTPLQTLPAPPLIKKSNADTLLEREADRVERAREKQSNQDAASKDKKPRKPFSSDELERRRKQLATARSKRKKKTETAPRDPNTKDLFEKNV